MTIKKITLFICASVLVTSSSYADTTSDKILDSISAESSRTMCSGIFVSRRKWANVFFQDLPFWYLHLLSENDVDYDKKTVTTSIDGKYVRKSIFREEVGCTLISNTSESELRSQVIDDIEHLPHNPENVQWPMGELDAVNDKPEGVDIAALNVAIDKAFEEPKPLFKVYTRAVLVVHKGKIIAEKYAPGINKDTALHGFSMSKGITNALVGIMIGQNKLSLDQRAPVQKWNKDLFDLRRFITIEDLLHMQSGLKWKEAPGIDRGKIILMSDMIEMLTRHDDFGDFASDSPYRYWHGTRFEYSSGSTNILHNIMKQELGTRANFNFPREELFNKIGMRTATLGVDSTGTHAGSSFLYASARDWIRFGLLYLNDGVWEGEQILPEGWVEYSTTPISGKSRKAGGYGAHWWLNQSYDIEGNLEYKDIPADAFQAKGMDGQSLMVIPSMDLVILRLGNASPLRAASFDNGVLATEIVKSFD